MQVVIVTGMSGAGKSIALKYLEDFGFYCVDNLPVPLIAKFAELAVSSENYQKIALGIDIRNHELLAEMKTVFLELKKTQADTKILFLDASDECLLKRYKESRRNHPLAGSGRIEEGIRKEREQVLFLLERADYVINTSHLLTRELRAQLEDIFLKGETYNNLFITVTSFGFKYGIPAEADLVFDVRFMPNPFYFERMRPLSGLDPEVRDFVLETPQAQEFLKKLTEMMEFLIPNYITEGKTQLVIAVGCTGGRHRSVAIAEALFGRLDSIEGCGVRVDHRDIYKDRK